MFPPQEVIASNYSPWKVSSCLSNPQRVLFLAQWMWKARFLERSSRDFLFWSRRCELQRPELLFSNSLQKHYPTTLSGLRNITTIEVSAPCDLPISSSDFLEKSTSMEWRLRQPDRDSPSNSNNLEPSSLRRRASRQPRGMLLKIWRSRRMPLLIIASILSRRRTSWGALDSSRL